MVSNSLFRVGERVRVVRHRNSHWAVDGGMDKYMGTIVTITRTGDYKIKEDNGKFYWLEEDFEKN